MTRSVATWSARQVYLAANSSKGSLTAAIRAGHIDPLELSHVDVLILRVAVVLANWNPTGDRRPANQIRPVAGWERAAVAVTRDAAQRNEIRLSTLLVVSHRGVSMETASDRAATMVTQMTGDGAVALCLPVGLWWHNRAAEPESSPRELAEARS
jgi:hypothetical protein